MTAATARDRVGRRARFFLLEKLALPLLAGPLRLWMRTWRLRIDAESLRRVRTTSPLVIASYHGMFLHLLGFSRLLRGHRSAVVIVSPSLDGRLLAACLARFGIGHVHVTTAARTLVTSVSRMRRGDVALVAVDGPLGPRGVVQPGFLKLADAAHASVAVVVTAASRGITFRSWDLAHLPFPFARVEARVELFPAPLDEAALPHVAAALTEAARVLGSPVLPTGVGLP